MPVLTGPADSGGNPVTSGLSGVWLPGPIHLPDYTDMVIGKLVLPWGPRRIEVQHSPQVVKQLTVNAVFRYDFGYLPNRYIIEGYPNGGDPEAMQAIVAQFGNDPLASVPLLVPILAIADMVVLTMWNPVLDANQAFREPFYHIELESSAGGYTDLVAGVAPVQSS